MGKPSPPYSSRTRRAPLTAALGAAALLVGAAPAWASQRYASPGSGDGSGGCFQAAPCTAQWAVTGASSGDDVVLEPGSYTLTSSLKPTAAITVHGQDGQPAPTLVVEASVNH